MPGPNPHVKSKVINGERMYWYGDARPKGCDVARTENRQAVNDSWDRIFLADCLGCGVRGKKREMVRVDEEPRGGLYVCAACHRKARPRVRREVTEPGDILRPHAWSDPKDGMP